MGENNGWLDFKDLDDVKDGFFLLHSKNDVYQKSQRRQGNQDGRVYHANESGCDGGERRREEG